MNRYKNPDPRCEYPYTPDPLGYCWSYAHHEDGNPKFQDLDKICPGCEFFQPPPSQGNAAPEQDPQKRDSQE